MRVLLLGEFSGVHTNLGKALKSLGHEVMMVSDGDSYRNFPTDLKINTHSLNLRNLYTDITKPLYNLKSLTGFDAVQLISPFIFNKKIPFYNELLLKWLKKHNEKVYLISAGSGYRYYQSNATLKYNACHSCETIDKKHGCPYIKPYAKHAQKEVQNIADHIIPLAYEYYLANKDDKKCTEIHNFPIDTSDKNIFNKVNKKLTFFHGVTEGRSGFKGSYIIKSALEKLERKYPNDVEVFVSGGIPFAEYIKLFENVNVVLDQVFSYSLAMNALNAMCTGKIVLGGAEPKAYEHLHYEGVFPALNVIPDEKQIIEQCEFILENRSRIPEWSVASSEFVHKYFDSIKIAKQFLNTWSN